EEIIWELVDTSIIRHQKRLLKGYPELAKEVESVARKVIAEPPEEWIIYADRLLYRTLEELSNSHRKLVERLKILIINVEYAPDEVNGARVDRILPQLDKNLYQELSTVIDNMVLKELESSIGFLNYVLNENSD
ncbi:MAG: hypothetical protein GTN76_17085, partial [Candidatus Aenigmarchaeota archaeon]|nr:hypothetical protein [Candidatus Aenigmarchaeota archaeon]